MEITASKIDKGASKLDRLLVWLRNASRFHYRLMARFIESRGWVAFYLEDDCRVCRNVCWMELYQQEQNRRIK